MPYKEKISCIIGTKNAEADIKDCIEAVKWVDEIIVIDDFSEDNTVEIARQYTDKILQRKMDGYSEQRNFALQKANYRWVLSLDADEWVTPQLKDEILEKLSIPSEFSAFIFRRLNIFLGREIKHCGWYERNNFRLFNKGKVSYDTAFKFLERYKVCGKVGVMENDLLHYTCRNLFAYLKRMNIWSTLNAEDLVNKGVRVSSFNALFYFIFKPTIIFLYKYFLKSGYLDGFEGFFICAFSAFTYLISYAKVWEWQKKPVSNKKSA